MRELHPGDVLAGYRIDEVLGRGGMGVVFRATHLRLERTDALKVIAPHLAYEQEFRSRFEREWRVAAKIDHPNVIPIYSAGEEEELLYIAMRYVDGTDVRAVLLRDGRIEPRRAARIVDAVGAALDAAHECGLVHRDVKPANVLLAHQREREHVYLTDFGLTKVLSSSGGETKTGMFVGTTDYVSPEQAFGAPLDARSDIYSLGCMLFHMLTGRVPYPVDFEPAKLVAHTQDPVPSVLEAAPDVPPAFEAVIQRAMAKRPDDRYLSAGDLGRAALAAVDGRPVTRAETSVARGAAAPTDVTEVGSLPAAAATPHPPAPREAASAPAERALVDPVAAANSAAGAPPSSPPRRSAPRWLPFALAGVVVAAVAVVLVVALGGSSNHNASANQQAGGSTGTSSGPVITTQGTPTSSAGGTGGLTPAPQLTTQNTTGSIALGQTATFALTDKGASGPVASIRAVSVNKHPVDQDGFLQGDPAGTTLVAVVFQVQSDMGSDDVTSFFDFGGTDSSNGNVNPDTIVAGPDCVFHNQTAGGPPLKAGQLLTFCLLYDPEPRTTLALVTASPNDIPQNLGIVTATWKLP